MVRRDYAARGKKPVKKKANKVNKSALLTIGIGIVAIFAVGLYLLKEKSTEHDTMMTNIDRTGENHKTKSTLPSRPEEVWSYIRDLETREIPIDSSSKSLDQVQHLTAEQKKILQMLEQDAQLAEATNITPNNIQPVPEKSHIKPAPTVVAPSTTTKLVAKFGLQCGAFKHREQAENLQAKLVMAGFDARVISSSTFNRIFIGPIGSRAAANATLQKAKAVANCVVIGM